MSYTTPGHGRGGCGGGNGGRESGSGGRGGRGGGGRSSGGDKDGPGKKKGMRNRDRNPRLVSHPENQTRKKRAAEDAPRKHPPEIGLLSGENWRNIPACIVIDDNSPSPPPTPAPFAAAAAAAAAVAAAKTMHTNSNAPMPQPTTAAVTTAAIHSAKRFTRRTTMINLLKKNDSKKNARSFAPDQLKSMLKALIDDKQQILDIVKDEDESLVAPMTEALERCKIVARTSKIDIVTQLVDVWIVFEQSPRLLNGSYGVATRARKTLDDFIGAMQLTDAEAMIVLGETVDSVKKMKSRPMPPGEMERRIDSEGSIAVNKTEFPCCPNPKCKHSYLSHPPSDRDADAHNTTVMGQYARLSRALELFKKKQGPQPVCPKTGEKLKKIPPPDIHKKHIRCHCKQLRADPRNGFKCPISCQGYQIGQCPICRCTCNLYITHGDYRDIATVNSMGEEEPQESAAEVRNWLNEGLNANNLQRRSSIEHYGRQMEEGRMDSRTDVTSNVVGEGAMAQALHMVRNRPDRATAAELQKKVDALAHRSGKTCVDMGGEAVDMRTWGKKSAAESRVDNNGLTHGVVHGITAGTAAKPPPLFQDDDAALNAGIRASMAQSAMGRGGGQKRDMRQQGVEVIECPQGWPFKNNGRSKQTVLKDMAGRVKDRSMKQKHLDKRKDDLTEDQKEERVRARQRLKRILRREGEIEEMARGWMVTKGGSDCATASQYSTWEKEKFQSQDGCEMVDNDDSDSE